MKKVFWIIAAVAGLSLSACSVQSDQQKMLQGQQYFQEQNYVDAYKTLKPLAEDGNADAQYALGYMYYYGKGVPKNYQEAMYWMTKAANQGQPLAKQALMQLQQELNNATSNPLGDIPSTSRQLSQTSKATTAGLAAQ